MEYEILCSNLSLRHFSPKGGKFSTENHWKFFVVGWSIKNKTSRTSKRKVTSKSLCLADLTWQQAGAGWQILKTDAFDVWGTTERRPETDSDSQMSAMKPSRRQLTDVNKMSSKICQRHGGHAHGLINYKDTKTGDTVSHVGTYFYPALWTIAPVTFSLVHLPPPPPQSTVYC